MNFLWGMGQMMYTKLIIVVDEEVNPQNVSEVAWRAFNNIDGKRDIVFSDGPLDALDHSSPIPRYGTRLGLDATRKIRAFEEDLEAKRKANSSSLRAQWEPSRKIPIIAMTANVFREDVEKCLAAGMNDHVGKPLDIKEVLEKLSKYMNQK
jgi:3-polyprenyl-4-hydroxybenzoate decarboxylase